MVPFVISLARDLESGREADVYKSEVERQGRIPRRQAPGAEVQLATGDIARQLELGVAGQVISRHQERGIDGTPWSLQTTFNPTEFGAARSSRDASSRGHPHPGGDDPVPQGASPDQPGQAA